MNKINLLLSFLCLPLLVVAQGVFPLVSPSGKMNADIRAGEKNVEIDLFANGEKVVTAKTLQFSLDENILKGNWTKKGNRSIRLGNPFMESGPS